MNQEASHMPIQINRKAEWIEVRRFVVLILSLLGLIGIATAIVILQTDGYVERIPLSTVNLSDLAEPCQQCGSRSNIVIDSLSTSNGGAMFYCRCAKCGRRWSEFWIKAMIGYQDMNQ